MWNLWNDWSAYKICFKIRDSFTHTHTHTQNGRRLWWLQPFLLSSGHMRDDLIRKNSLAIFLLALTNKLQLQPIIGLLYHQGRLVVDRERDAEVRLGWAPQCGGALVERWDLYWSRCAKERRWMIATRWTAGASVYTRLRMRRRQCLRSCSGNIFLYCLFKNTF